MKKSQIKFVMSKLNKDGYITRNYALLYGITRLSAIIYRITERHGYGFKTERVALKNRTWDYKYTLNN